jgi:hypothetical protein
MHSKEIIAIVAFFLLVLVTGSLYFNDYPGITGAVIAGEAKESEFYGTYSINPSFKTTIDYDLSEYDKVIEGAKEIKEACYKDYNFEDCIINKINEFNNKNKEFDWALNCEPEEQKFFYEFIEKYLQCFDSAEEEGICEFSLQKGPEKKNFIIKLSDINGKTSFELADQDLTETADIEGLYIADKIDPQTGEVNKLNQENIDILLFFDKDGKAKARIQAQDDLGNPITFETEDMINLYKDKTNSISFIDQSVYSSFKASKQIYKPVKNTFRFCVDSSKEFYVYDKKTELKKIQYKFALKFADHVPPPPIEDIRLRDKLKDENSVLISWEKSPANDVKNYTIFYSENDFKGQEIKDLLSDTNIEKINLLENKKTDLEEIYLSDCGFNPIGEPCI